MIKLPKQQNGPVLKKFRFGILSTLTPRVWSTGPRDPTLLRDWVENNRQNY